MPRRGPSRTFNADLFLDAALEIADVDGTGAINIRALTAAINVSPMTIYTYFENKEGLLDAMVQRALDGVAHTPDPAVPWQEQMAAAMRSMHAAFIAHPSLAELLLRRPTSDPMLDPIRESMFATLLDAGFDETSTVQAIGLLTDHLVGAAIREHRRHADTDERARLDRLPPDIYPRLRQVARQYGISQHDWIAGYENDLSFLINAIERLKGSASGDQVLLS
ncbi:TetR/AcrR family transcriptional regulator [Nocardioides sp. WS12]|uniref:TetR/AcrR family transcriptional regulator n=1 Tax=Nocardioides sp. WS12 TaxID=2486272 RepID=UPI0015F8F3E6|nr:TetR/AcrR family transcriptional regulator [Nocardioides sp. WS12]